MEMKKTAAVIGVLVIMGMLLTLCLVSKAEARSRIGLFVGPSLSLEELNDVFDDLNEELGTDFRFKEEGLMYSLVIEDSASSKWRKGIDFSIRQEKVKDTIIHPWIGNQKDEIDIELGLTIAPIFLTRTYVLPLKGNLSLRLGLGLGTVLTLINVSQEKTTYFWDQDGNLQEVNEQSNKSLVMPTLGGQLSTGIEYKLGKNSILLEARYVSGSIKIQDPEADPRPIDIEINWNKILYRIGIIIRT